MTIILIILTVLLLIVFITIAIILFSINNALNSIKKTIDVLNSVKDLKTKFDYAVKLSKKWPFSIFGKKITNICEYINLRIQYLSVDDWNTIKYNTNLPPFNKPVISVVQLHNGQNSPTPMILKYMEDDGGTWYHGDKQLTCAHVIKWQLIDKV